MKQFSEFDVEELDLNPIPHFWDEQEPARSQLSLISGHPPPNTPISE